MAALEIVHIVRRHQFQPKLTRPLNEPRIHLRLLRDAVVLQLQVKMIRPEDLFKPVQGISSLLLFVADDRLRNLAGQAA